MIACRARRARRSSCSARSTPPRTRSPRHPKADPKSVTVASTDRAAPNAPTLPVTGPAPPPAAPPAPVVTYPAPAGASHPPARGLGRPDARARPRTLGAAPRRATSSTRRGSTAASRGADGWPWRSATTRARCGDWSRQWPPLLDRFHPDLVVVLSTIWDVGGRQRRPSGDSGFVDEGDPRFDQFIEGEWRQAETPARVERRPGRVADRPLRVEPVVTGRADLREPHVPPGWSAPHHGRGDRDLYAHVCPGGSSPTSSDRSPTAGPTACTSRIRAPTGSRSGSVRP